MIGMISTPASSQMRLISASRALRSDCHVCQRSTPQAKSMPFRSTDFAVFTMSATSCTCSGFERLRETYTQRSSNGPSAAQHAAPVSASASIIWFFIRQSAD